jgi:hypothetical protein
VTEQDLVDELQAQLEATLRELSGSGPRSLPWNAVSH